MSRHLLAFDRNREQRYKLRDRIDSLFLLRNLEQTERRCVFVNFNLELFHSLFASCRKKYKIDASTSIKQVSTTRKNQQNVNRWTHILDSCAKFIIHSLRFSPFNLSFKRLSIFLVNLQFKLSNYIQFSAINLSFLTKLSRNDYNNSY